MKERFVKYLPLALFLLFSLKLLVKGAELSDAPALLILAASACFYEFKSQYRKITELETKVKEIHTISEETRRYAEEARNYVSASKLGGTMRSTNGINR